MNEEEIVRRAQTAINRFDSLQIVGAGWTGNSRQGFQFNPESGRAGFAGGGATPTPTTSGACCPTEGDCFVATQSICEAGGGTYQGDDTTCDPDPCAGCPDCGGLFVVGRICGFFDGFAFYDDWSFELDQSGPGCSGCEPHIYCDILMEVAEHIVGCPPNVVSSTYEMRNLRVCSGDPDVCEADPTPCGTFINTFTNEVTIEVVIARTLASLEGLGGCPDGCVATYVLDEDERVCTAFCDGPGCATGACCHGSTGTNCSVVTATACGYLGGGYIGDDTPCTPDPC